MIKNINYRGVIPPDEMTKIKFPAVQTPPYQKIVPLQKGKLVIFTSGKCRIMGLNQPLTGDEVFPVSINDLRIQSVTAVHDLGFSINLLTLARLLPRKDFMFEPELFPALRLKKFNPLCVNVFASGKIVILGLKKLTNQNVLRRIIWFLRVYIQGQSDFKITFHQDDIDIEASSAWSDANSTNRLQDNSNQFSSV